MILFKRQNPNSPEVPGKIKDYEMFKTMVEEARKLVQNKEVQAMLLAEKYAIADLNAIKAYERNQGFEQGFEQGFNQGIARYTLQVYQNCIQRGISKEEAIAISEIDEKVIPD